MSCRDTGSAHQAGGAGRPLERRPARFGSYRNGRRSRIHQLTTVPRLGIGSCDRRHQLYLPIPIIFWTPLKSAPVAEFFWRWELAAEKGDGRVSNTHARQHCDIHHNGSSGFGGNADSAEIVIGALSLSRVWCSRAPRP